ncbi:BtrH N-terminal domain-containing protein [Streptomyces sp. NPDC008163]|uniref:BtrH N-terminal domain-containing protein n=1 Tax=Streptomyces sp. NPDC008163 TaxID=3364818 RepID=UPI0036EB4611
MVILQGIESRGTEHCETTALGVLLRAEGVDLSEAMLFGIGSGLSFVYWDSKAMGFPFLGGRVKPFELSRELAPRLGAELLVSETSSPRTAWRNVVAALDGGSPVGLQLDSFHLEYFRTKVHFGGHVVAMYGYDEQDAHLVDTGAQGGAVTTSLTSLAAARAERGPMTARHRSFRLALHGSAPVPLKECVVPAIAGCADAFLNPPIANLGHRGIAKAARQVPKWLDRPGDPREGVARTAELMERGGTGGALFRNLYRDFLAECGEVVAGPRLRTGHALYTEAAGLWTQVAALLAVAGRTGDAARLAEAGAVLRELARVEHEAMRALSALG